MKKFMSLSHCPKRLVIWMAIGLACCSAVTSGFAQFGFHGGRISAVSRGPDNTSRAHVGEVVTMEITIDNLDDFGDTLDITNVVAIIKHSSGSVTSVVFAPHFPLHPNGGSLTLLHPFLVLPGDEAIAANPGVLIASARVEFTDLRNGAGGAPVGFSLQSLGGQVQILAPSSLSLTKTAPAAPGLGGQISFSCVLQNSGTVLLNNVVASNQISGSFQYLLGPLSLAPGQSISFSGIEPWTDPCLPAANSVHAWGTDALLLTVTTSAASPCRPTLLLPRRLPDGSAAFDFAAQSGRTYSVQATTNLTTWTTLTDLPGVNGTITFRDTGASLHPRRIYRLLLP